MKILEYVGLDTSRVKAHYAKMGEPEEWNELVAQMEHQSPGFKVVQ